ncbi:MAG TPA: AMP-binding protein [Crenalkalicoccus sp.]|nr:AMP-binding protein [Crenalkalicoccus sp.]
MAALEPIETASVAALRALQRDRLRAAVRRAHDGLRFYRDRFAAAGLRPEDIRELPDIARIPFTTKEDLRAHYPYGLFAVPMEQVVRLHASSGTTGRPTVIGYTREDLDLWAALVARSLRAAGVTARDRVHVAYGYGLFTGGLGLHYGAERLGCAVVPVGGGFTERHVQLIQDLRPEVVAVTPSYLLAIGDAFERAGLDPAASSLRVAILGAEPWTEAMRAEIERRFRLDALDIYGLSEVMGPGVAQECLETKDGLTLWEDHFYPEIIDPATGEVLPEGEEGELVLTTLTKQATPLLRYRTRDLTRLLPGTARPMRRLARLKGRSDDMLIIRGVNVFPSQIEAVLAREAPFAPHYRLEVRREGRLDTLDVFVELRDAAADRASAAARAEELIKAFVGVTTAVHCLDPGAIARSEGKAKRVIDRRGES